MEIFAYSFVPVWDIPLLWDLVFPLILIFGFVYWIRLQFKLDEKASLRRRDLINSRLVINKSEWERCLPSISFDKTLLVLQTIAKELDVDVDPNKLTPDDTFEDSLALKGWHVIDDDTTEDIAEQVEEQLGVQWNEEWKTVQDAIQGIAQELEGIKCD